MNEPNVYFVGSAYMGCNYVRCLLPQMYGGWDGTLTSIYKDRKPEKEITRDLQRADIVFFHRPDSIAYHRLAQKLVHDGKLIVFDNDDTGRLDKGHPFYNLTSHGNTRRQKKYNTILNNFIRNANAATASTEFLAEEYKEHNSNVFTLPNCVDPDDWPEPKRNEGDKVRILLSGSTVYSLDFSHVKDYLRELDERDDVQLIIQGLLEDEKRKKNPRAEKVYEKEYSFWGSLKNLESHPWGQMEDYFESLNDLKADIMLIPRGENYFARCKSNIKFLEASMCEIPVVAQSFTTKDSPYDKDLNGKNGLLATDAASWKEQVDKLIKDKDLRRKMGKTAYDYVVDNYHIENHIYKWDELFNSLYEERWMNKKLTEK